MKEEKKTVYVLMYASYSEVDCELFVDCLGIFDTYEEAEAAEAKSREEDEEDKESNCDREYRIRTMKA